MPRELVAIAPRTPALREYQEPTLAAGQVRLRSEFAAPKHGTELALYRAISSLNAARWDNDQRIFLPREGDSSPGFPMPLGNMTVGRIAEIGPEVTGLAIGDRVFGHLPIRETHTVPASRVEPVPEGMSPEAIVYWDPAEFALGAVRDGRIRLGDRVVVFGLGAIGLMALQMARLSGAEWLAAVDPLPLRRAAAARTGADVTYDPAAQDVGLAIRQATGGGADVALESSGAYPALHEAIRCAHLGGVVVPLAFYTGEARGLRLGEEWHFNRITMLSSRSISDPNRDHPMWDSGRIKETAFRLLRDGALTVQGLVTPIVPFEECAEAYRDIDEHPEKSIKLGVIFD